MPITPKDAFDFSIKRSEHFLTLYDLLHDTRVRRARSDWLQKFRSLMHWPQTEAITRIDGKDRNSLLIIREAVGIDASSFSHDYSSELLRSATSSSVSALDRYMHDLVSHRCWRLLRQPEHRVPKDLARLRIPALATKKALEKLRSDPTARPGTIIRKEIQDVLHREFTFQNPASMDNAARMLGVDDFWGKVAREIRPRRTKGEIQDQLRSLARRRNQIVHEADLVIQAKSRSIRLREISREEVHCNVEFVKLFVAAIDNVVN